METLNDVYLKELSDIKSKRDNCESSYCPKKQTFFKADFI